MGHTPTPPDFTGPDSPLAAALDSRDRETMAMVQAAVARKEVMLAFQPVVAAQSPETPVFWEGLIRVLDPTGRIIPARDFMGAVETQELGRKLDVLALEEGIAVLAAQPELKLALNLSARSIGYGPWRATLDRGLRTAPDIAGRLILEITESSAMMVPDLVTAFMADLRASGLIFALDDFGAGFTSFRYLRDFYFDIIKIDGQFVRGVATDTDNQVLMQAMVQIGQQLDMLTVAEQVETRADAAFLAGIGLDCLQGYLYGAPTTRPPWTDTGD